MFEQPSSSRTQLSPRARLAVVFAPCALVTLALAAGLSAGCSVAIPLDGYAKGDAGTHGSKNTSTDHGTDAGTTSTPAGDDTGTTTTTGDDTGTTSTTTGGDDTGTTSTTTGGDDTGTVVTDALDDTSITPVDSGATDAADDTTAASDSSTVTDSGTTTIVTGDSAGGCPSAGTGILATFDFSSAAGDEVTLPGTSALGATVGPLSRSSALARVTGSGSMNASGWTSSSAYYTFSVTPPSGCKVAPGTLSAALKSSGTGPTSASAGSSLSSFAATGSGLASFSATFSGTGAAGASVEIRIFGAGATSSGGTMRVTSLSLSGALE
jgi:hypothetical protein